MLKLRMTEESQIRSTRKENKRTKGKQGDCLVVFKVQTGGPTRHWNEDIAWCKSVSVRESGWQGQHSNRLQRYCLPSASLS